MRLHSCAFLAGAVTLQAARKKRRGSDRESSRWSLDASASSSTWRMTNDDDLWGKRHSAPTRRCEKEIQGLEPAEEPSPVASFLDKELKTYFQNKADRALFLKAIGAEGLAACHHLKLHVLYLSLWREMSCVKESIKELLHAIRDGWMPVPEVAGEDCTKIMSAMTWMGRTAAKRMVKQIASDLDAWHDGVSFLAHLRLACFLYLSSCILGNFCGPRCQACVPRPFPESGGD